MSINTLVSKCIALAGVIVQADQPGRVANRTRIGATMAWSLEIRWKRQAGVLLTPEGQTWE
jgi:hypothetical protein